METKKRSQTIKPKKQAEILLVSMYKQVNKMNTRGASGVIEVLNVSTDCVLIGITEMLRTLEHTEGESILEHWQEVEQEVKKLTYREDPSPREKGSVVFE